MSDRYRLPDVADLVRLGEPHERAVTVYARTDPTDRDLSRRRVRAAVDAALERVRATGASAAVMAALRGEWDELHGADLWSSLATSLAIFIADDGHEAYVLANEFDDQVHVGTTFDVGQLVRAVTTPQEAYALTLSSEGWNLWHATASTRATEIALASRSPLDVADATNRATVRDRGHVGRLVGDEGRKVLLEKYAARVAEAVDVELRLTEPDVPLFIFATAPLRDMYAAAHDGRPLVLVEGASDRLVAHEIDEVIRTRLPAVNAERVGALVERMLAAGGSALVATDLAEIARASVQGAVGALVYDLTASEPGVLDAETGEVRFTASGPSLLSALAVAVLDRGGTVVAVRPGEVSAQGWNGAALASLRRPLG